MVDGRMAAIVVRERMAGIGGPIRLEAVPPGVYELWFRAWVPGPLLKTRNAPPRPLKYSFNSCGNCTAKTPERGTTMHGVASRG